MTSVLFMPPRSIDLSAMLGEPSPASALPKSWRAPFARCSKLGLIFASGPCEHPEREISAKATSKVEIVQWIACSDLNTYPTVLIAGPGVERGPAATLLCDFAAEESARALVRSSEQHLAREEPPIREARHRTPERAGRQELRQARPGRSPTVGLL